MNLLLHNSKNKFNPKPDELTLKIADFGISRTVSNKTLATTCLGTPVYMAPEIWLGEKYDHKADLWSIGIIIYECLFGKLPFSLVDFMSYQIVLEG
jgi:serine/threonine-protein kinase ULK2